MSVLVTMLIFTRREVISTTIRPFVLDGGMKNDIKDMRTLMPETRELTTVAVLTVLTVLKSAGVNSDCAGTSPPCILVARRNTIASFKPIERTCS